MFSKLIQIAVVFGCLLLISGAVEFPSSKWNKSSPHTYRLPSDTKPETYNISLHTGISEGHFDYDGHVSIDILVVNATRTITLHSQGLRIQKIQLNHANESGNDHPIDLLRWKTESDLEFLIIPTKEIELQQGHRYRLQITYIGRLTQTAKGFYRAKSGFSNDNWIAATQFEPFYARKSFPCYDEPGLKANVTIQITHGAKYTAASNMPGTPHNNSDGTVTTRFATSPAMSTYLIAFAVTNFRYRSNAANASLPMGVYVTPNAFNQTQFLLDQSEKSVKILEKYLQIPFALPKLDQIVTEKQPGPMENWGLIAYNKDELHHSNDSATGNLHVLSSAVAHEVAHQWFGNLVTPKWWNSNWLKEAFAKFFQYVVWREMLPQIDIMQTYNEVYRRAMTADEQNSSMPITRYVDTRDEIMKTYNRDITYSKGACLIRMFSHALTKPSFKKGITNYLRNNAFSTVDENDLFDELDRAAKEDGTLSPNLNVNQLFSTWTRQAGFPLLTVTRDYQNGSITISQERYLNDTSSDMNNATWWIPYNFATANSPSFNDRTPHGWLPQHQRTQLIEPNGNNSWNASEWVLFNKQRSGFYRVMYDTRNWKLLIDELHAGPNFRIHPMNRAQLIEDALHFEQSGRLPAGLLLEIVKYLKHETELAPWDASHEALMYLKNTLMGTENYESFREIVSLSIESAMASLQCKCEWEPPTCVILQFLSRSFGLKTCPEGPEGSTQMDLSMKAGDKFYRYHRLATKSYETV